MNRTHFRAIGRVAAALLVSALLPATLGSANSAHAQTTAAGVLYTANGGSYTDTKVYIGTSALQSNSGVVPQAFGSPSIGLDPFAAVSKGQYSTSTVHYSDIEPGCADPTIVVNWGNGWADYLNVTHMNYCGIDIPVQYNYNAISTHTVTASANTTSATASQVAVVHR